MTGEPVCATAPKDREAVESALRSLADVLGDREPPCWADPERWGDPRNAAEAEQAVDGCLDCRGLFACQQYAELVRPACGVWGGREYRSGRPRQRSPRRSA